ncbi:MAG: putative maltokinase, partial [Candidatus Acidiferrales bacterium]
LGPLLANNRRKIELLNTLLFSMPGTPIIYYGDEIGMGDNFYLGDRNGCRTPMQWSPDRNAGFSRASSQRLYLPVITEPDYHYESVNVEARQQNSQSLLWWMKRLIAMRRRHQALSRGSIEFLHPENARVLAFIRRYENETMLVVANLSRHAQYAELNLSAYKGMVPAELAGPTEFPAIGELPYLLTIGGHSFYWFVLEPQRVTEVVGEPRPAESLPLLQVEKNWKELFDANGSARLARILPDFLRTRRWFGGKARRIKSVALQDRVELGDSAAGSTLAFLNVEFAEGDPENYALVLHFATGEEAARVQNEQSEAMIARLRTPAEEGILYSPLREPHFAHAMLALVGRRRKLRGVRGEVAGQPARAFHRLRGEDLEALPVNLIGAEQSNSSLIYGDRLILKLFRRLEPGLNPDYELNSYLAEQAQFRNVPPVAGKIEYRVDKSEPVTLGVLQGYVRNEGDAWKHTLDALSRYFEQIAVLPPELKQQPAPHLPLLPTEDPLPARPADQIGPYLESARMLGQRTAEMHVALAAGGGDAAFAPEPFTPFYQRSLYQSMRNLLRQAFALLRKQLPRLPEEVRGGAEHALDRENEILRQFRMMLDKKITAQRTRVHGDYHLGQVLHTGGDFVIIDFEGEPARSITERRIKRSPLRDVAGMLRSFNYAAYAALFGLAGSGAARPEDFQALESWGNLWSQCVSSTFLRAYLGAAAGASEGARFLPYKKEELEGLLRLFLLEKAVCEIRYELNHRPAWLRIPLTGIRQLLDEAGKPEAK